MVETDRGSSTEGGQNYSARGIVRGRAEGEALVCAEAFSFLGDVDMDSGEIIARGHEHVGETISGKVMVYPETKGSSGGCIVLMTLAKAERPPAAIVLGKPADPNIVEGAILAGIPLLCQPEAAFLASVRTGDRIAVDADAGRIEVSPAAAP
jgi:predicted aconitase with swiveling domain